jgi:hypothetical protein
LTSYANQYSYSKALESPLEELHVVSRAGDRDSSQEANAKASDSFRF